MASRYRLCRRSCSGASGAMFSTSSTVKVPIEFGGAVEPLGHPAELGDEVAGLVVGVDVVVGVAGVEHRVEQLLLGLEVMQQPGGRHPGFLGDLRQRGVAPAVACQQPLGDAENPLPAVLAFGEKRGVGPWARTLPPNSFVQPT